MNVANELLDAIEIIVDKKVRENTTQIYLGICKSVSGSSCVMSINGKDNTIQFYGSIPTVGAIYRVFVPDGNMSMAFIITGNDDRKDLHYSNPNFLDNWYFGNPVNQRGQTSWVNPSDWQYAIDRWQITPSSVIALVDGGITIIADFHQGLEKERLEFGRTYTFSVLSSDGRLGKHTFVLTSDTDINVGFGFGYFVCYLSGDNVWFRIYGDGSAYKAAKLELGSQQTLAHQDANGNWVLNEIPNYGEQLARCQRYFQTFATESLRPTNALDFRPVMWATPALSTITVGGKTLYTASADL